MIKSLSSPSEWGKEIGNLQYIINNTYHSTIKTTPAKLMFGFDQRCHDDARFAQFTELLINVDADLEARRNQTRGEANAWTDIIRKYNKIYSGNKFHKPLL